ncbi:MAG: OmpA family protein [Methylophagaceae bacterium]
MYTKTLLCSLLLIASPTILANPVYQQETPNPSHNEVTAGSVGLVAGTLIAGPFGAIIGGSLGVMTGHQQTKTETITEQKYFITELEQELDVVSAQLAQSKIEVSQLENSQKQIQDELQHYGDGMQEVIHSYQFDIYFMSNDNAVQSHAQQGLLKLVELLKNNPDIEARIDAHSDWRGSDDDNFQLAQKRLDSIANYLSTRGVNNVQILTTNYGENENMNKGSWGEELFYDRRVTITLSVLDR